MKQQCTLQPNIQQHHQVMVQYQQLWQLQGAPKNIVYQQQYIEGKTTTTYTRSADAEQVQMQQQQQYLV